MGQILIGRRERKSLETRQRIIASAMHLFGERGFLNTRVEDITEHADIGKGTFFNYFPNKEAIFAGFGETQRGKVAAAFAEYRDGREPLPVVLRRMAHNLTAELSANPRVARAIFSVVFANHDIQQGLRRKFALGRRTISAILKIAQERGEVRRDIPARRMARTLQQIIFGSMSIWSLNYGSALEGWLDPAIQIYCDGILERKS